MSNIRVLIGDAPTLVRNILEQALSCEPDMEIIPRPVMALPAADQLDSPDVVVDVSDSEPAESARVLLARWPRCHLLIITARGQRVLKFELQPCGVDLGEMSPAQLAEAIRDAVRPGRKPYAH